MEPPRNGELAKGDRDDVSTGDGEVNVAGADSAGTTPLEPDLTTADNRAVHPQTDEPSSPAVQPVSDLSGEPLREAGSPVGDRPNDLAQVGDSEVRVAGADTADIEAGEPDSAAVDRASDPQSDSGAELLEPRPRVAGDSLTEELPALSDRVEAAGEETGERRMGDGLERVSVQEPQRDLPVDSDLEALLRSVMAPAEGDRSPVSPSSDLSPEEERAGIYVNHAGLVLLHPFLQIYFDDIGLLAGNAFRDEYAQQTAIYLLHYLASGTIDAPEYALVLPKLLCNWPLNQTAICGDIPPRALTEGEHLLQVAIDHWQVLKSTSPDGLREGFLQRDGKLTRTDSGWKLRVEQKAMDILLSRLPWGLSMVTLSWMEALLTVEWT